MKNKMQYESIDSEESLIEIIVSFLNDSEKEFIKHVFEVWEERSKQVIKKQRWIHKIKIIFIKVLIYYHKLFRGDPKNLLNTL